MCMSITWAQNVAKIGTTECSTLQAAIDSARARHGNQTIEFLTDITENVFVIEDGFPRCVKTLWTVRDSNPSTESTNAPPFDSATA